MLLSLSFFDVGTGPFGFGPTPKPLAAIQVNFRRCGSGAAMTGYDAVGTRPSSRGDGSTRPSTTIMGRRPPPGKRFDIRHGERRANSATASSPELALVR